MSRRMGGGLALSSEERHPQEVKSGIDNLAEQTARFLAQGASRRGVLAWLGKALFATVAGIVLAPILPLDRRVSEAACSTCPSWQYCGMHGVPCANCSGGSDSQCACGNKGNAWTYCCPACSSGCCSCYVTYQDCCGCAPSCNSTWCTCSSEPNWCGSAGAYACTLAIVGNSCGGTGICPC